MVKKTVKLLQTWKNYEVDDIASFDPITAGKLIDGKVAIAYDPAATSEALPALTDADRAALDEREGAMKAAEARLSAREIELAAREAALAEKEAATGGAGGSEDMAEEPAAEAEAGAPPKQGKK